MAGEGGKSFHDIEGGPRPSPPDESEQSNYSSSDAADDDDEESTSAHCEINASRFSASDCSLQDDLERGASEPEKAGRDCRICHLSLETASPDSGAPIVLGCSCKDDLAAAHKQCAETWFKIKGNKTCEICGTTAKNVIGSGQIEFMEHWNEAAAAALSSPAQPSETRSSWQGHRLLNVLLACVVFAFVTSWLFHFNAPS